MKHYVFLGLLLGLLAAYPHLAVTAAPPALAAVRWLLSQPAAWAFAVGLLARPRIAHRLRTHTTGRVR